MRRIAAILLLTACVILGIIACSDDSSSPTDNLALGTLTATVDGTAFVSTVTPTDKDGETIKVAGAQTDNSGSQVIVINITDAKVGDNSSRASATYSFTPKNTGSMAVWNASKPTVNITKLTDKEIAGTFSFKGTNPMEPSSTKEIKNGKFRVSLAAASL